MDTDWKNWQNRFLRFEEILKLKESGSLLSLSNSFKTFPALFPMEDMTAECRHVRKIVQNRRNRSASPLIVFAAENDNKVLRKQSEKTKNQRDRVGGNQNRTSVEIR
ncbi:unnamed protein product [Caenorhabditis nigoni]